MCVRGPPFAAHSMRTFSSPSLTPFGVRMFARANILTPKGVKEGLEKVRMLWAANGGPRTHMSLGPYDHKAYKGDWLVLRKIVGGRTVWVDLHDPVKTTPPGR